MGLRFYDCALLELWLGPLFGNCAPLEIVIGLGPSVLGLRPTDLRDWALGFALAARWDCDWALVFVIAPGCNCDSDFDFVIALW